MSKKTSVCYGLSGGIVAVVRGIVQVNPAPLLIFLYTYNVPPLPNPPYYHVLVIQHMENWN